MTKTGQMTLQTELPPLTPSNPTAIGSPMSNNIIRMKELKLSDYYSEADKKRDIAAIEAFFDKKKKAEKHLDGIKMIGMFVNNNRMS